MTEDEWKKWFEKAKKWLVIIEKTSPPDRGQQNGLPIEELYQNFKSRLASESALVLFPKEPEKEPELSKNPSGWGHE